MSTSLDVLNRCLLIVALASLITACLKNPEEKHKTREEFGPEISVSDLRSHYVTMPAPSLYNIQKGDFASVERRQIVENQRPSVVMSSATTAMSRTESESQIDFVLELHLLEYVNGQPKPEPSIRELPRSLAKKTSSLLEFIEKILAPFPLRFSMITESVANSRMLEQQIFPSLHQLQNVRANIFRPLAASTATYSYHNFARKELVLAVPEAARSRPKCGGRETDLCATGIRAEQISFDEVTWEEGKPPRKVSNLLITSADLPFFFLDSSDGPQIISFLLSCGEGLVELQSQKVHLIDCTEMKDFRLGGG